MNEISLREVTADNWRATLRLTVHPEQQRFIAESTPIAAIALAKAYIRPGGLAWTPYAIYAGADMIGLVELAYLPESHDDYWVFHFFIDRAQQSQGYGTAAFRAFIGLVLEQHPRCRQLQLTVHPENDRARSMYLRLGFQPTGQMLFDEPVYTLQLRDAEHLGSGMLAG